MFKLNEDLSSSHFYWKYPLTSITAELDFQIGLAELWIWALVTHLFCFKHVSIGGMFLSNLGIAN